MSKYLDYNTGNASGFTRLHHLFERQVMQSPEHIAVTLGGARASYSELNSRANGVAFALQAAGIVSGALVGVVVDRSIDALASLLGVLKSGAAYVPVAAELPEERMNYIVERAAIKVFVGSAAALTVAELPVVRKIDAGAVASRTDSPTIADSGGDKAWVIFTSGSTGQPKGVVVNHEQIVNSTLARLDVFPLPCSSYVMLAPFSFDASAAGTYLTLATGGRLVVPTDEQVSDPALLAELIVAEGATHLDGVPSQYAALVAFHPAALASLRCCIMAGEALHVALVDDHYAVAPATPLYNEYGPTEGTVWSAVHRCRPGERGSTAPIGRPIRGVRVYVLDQDLKPVLAGETGEIHIAGAGLAQGYLGEPSLTADRFIPNPYGDRPGDRLYRTGDLGAIDEDGNLLFRGRVDNQVKVRGFRVELEEVEAALLAHPEVAAAAVVTRQAPKSIKLVAYTVLQRTGAVTTKELSAFVRKRIPDYMVPADWHMISRLPLTPHGKIDRRRLSEGKGSDAASASTKSFGENRLHVVVCNASGNYSVWEADRSLPDGWGETGYRGERNACLARIAEKYHG